MGSRQRPEARRLAQWALKMEHKTATAFAAGKQPRDWGQGSQCAEVKGASGWSGPGGQWFRREKSMDGEGLAWQPGACDRGQAMPGQLQGPAVARGSREGRSRAPPDPAASAHNEKPLPFLSHLRGLWGLRAASSSVVSPFLGWLYLPFPHHMEPSLWLLWRLIFFP